MERGNRRLQWAAGITAAMSVAQVGCFLGWMSPTLTRLEAPDSPIPISPDQGSWIASINSLTIVVTLFVVPVTVDRFGRKKLLLASALPFIAHFLIAAFANSFEMLMAARIIGSIGGGLAQAVSPMYLSEISETEIRGMLITMFQLLTYSGTLFIYSVAPYVSYKNSALIALTIPLLFFSTFMWMPESPYFLLLRGEEDEATKELLKLRGKSDVSSVTSEMLQMRQAIQSKEETRGSFKDLFLQPGNRRTLILVSGISVFQLFSGSIAITTYSTTIFDASASSLDADVSSIIIACVQLVMAGVSSALVDRVGRRPLLICTFIVCSVSLVGEAVYFLLSDTLHTDVSAIGWLPLTALVLFQISYSMGVGPVPPTLIGEMFHVSVKGVASPFINMLTSVSSFTVKKLFQVVSDSIGITYNFWAFGLLSAVGAAFTFILLPETKGKTFAQINDEMDSTALGRKPKSEKATLKI